MSFKKGALIGGIIFFVLVIIYKISGLIVPCVPSGMEGDMCINNFQEKLLAIFFILSFPSLLLEIGSPGLSSMGPVGVAIFWITGFIVSLVLGGIIGWIFRKKIKKK